MKFQATIYRTSAQCGIKGEPSRSIAGAFDSARRKAGRLFVLGMAPSGTRWGYDATAFLEDAEQHLRTRIFRRLTCPRASLRDGSSDVTLEIVRV